MKALSKLQHSFAADLWGSELQYLDGLILDDGISAANRLNVYRNNFRISLTEALAAIYPVVQKLVGDEFFGFMADRYIRTYPSRSGSIQELGSDLDSFLRAFQPASDIPYLSDVSRLEWAYHRVFHAAAAPPFQPDYLQHVSAHDYPQLRFVLGPACRLVCSSYPVFRIWKINQEGYAGDINVNLDEGAESVLVVRPELQVELWRIEPVEATFLNALASGATLGAAVEECLVHSSDFDLQTLLQRCLSSGALAVVES